MDGQARVSTEVVARYAGDAAREVPGVAGLVESQLHRHSGVRLSGDRERPQIVIHVRAEWNAPLRQLGRQARHFERQHAKLDPARLEVAPGESAGGQNTAYGYRAETHTRRVESRRSWPIH